MQIDPTTPLAFVDLETTGTSPRRHRVIEVGIVRVEGGEVVREYKTLVNPGELVPSFITGLTGISTAMLQGAPQFDDVAFEVAELLEGALFVAHNAPFDYGFLGEEFRRLGIEFSYPYLCTAKLSRELFPKEKQHNLESIIERYGFTFESRHRALDDARVLHQLLGHARASLGDEQVFAAMQEMVRVRRLPLHVKESDVTKLPERPGVYFFHGKKDELLYVGKSRKIRTRVRSHFSADALSGRGRDMLSEIRRIEYQETVSELGALLLESHLIKTRAPVYNIRERERHALCLAREYTDAAGYSRVELGYADTIERGEETSILGVYKSTKQAKELLTALVKDYALCPALLGLEKIESSPTREGSRACFSHQLEGCVGACAGTEKPRHYNKRFREAFDKQRLKHWPYAGPVAIEEQAPDGGKELFVVDNWRLLAALTLEDGEWAELVPARFRFDYDAYKIFSRELLKKKPKVAVRDLTSVEQQWLSEATVR